MKKEYLPNLLTVCRITLSFWLMFLPCPSVLFILLYLICGCTDFLDGVIARRLKAETLLGARLDSLADLFLCAVIILTVIRQTHANIPVIIGICAVFTVRAFNAAFSKRKFGQVLSIHTVANKTAGLLFFLCPLTGAFTNIPLYLTGVVALLSSIEESLILRRPGVPDLNRKSVFEKCKQAAP